MPSRADQGGDGPPTEVFVSYSPSDERWAAWIAWQLEVAGFRTLLRAWDLPPGSPVEDFAERGMRGAAVIVAVLSRAYLGSGGVAAERQVALRTDAARLVTVRVDDGDGAPHSTRTVDLTGVRRCPQRDAGAAGADGRGGGHADRSGCAARRPACRR